MAELNAKRFETLATLLRANGPSKEAARLVLVEGKSIKDAVAATGVLQPAVSRSVARYREKHRLIVDGYELTI